jgi:hypothetical protein
VKLRIGYLSRNLTMSLLQLIPRAPLAAMAGAALLYGCASSSQSASEAATPAATPLSGLIGRQILVLPAQFLAVANPGGSFDIVPAGASMLPILDEEIADAFHKRGVKSNWTFGREITEAAGRQGGLAGDPQELGAQGIRRTKAGDTPLPEPLGTQIRNLVALTNARFAVLPLEVRVDTRGGIRNGSMHVLLVDARTARVTWAGDVLLEPARDPQIVADVFTPYGFRQLARELASRFADMVVAQ